MEPKHGKDHFTQILVVQKSAQNIDLGIYFYALIEIPLWGDSTLKCAP
jgi:hypothetical protein